MPQHAATPRRLAGAVFARSEVARAFDGTGGSDEFWADGQARAPVGAVAQIEAGRPHAPVSMPIAWAQVKRGLDLLRFTLLTVPPLLKKSKAWPDCDAERPPLEALAKPAKQSRLMRAA